MITVRRPTWPEDAEAIGLLDPSFTTSFKYDVAILNDSITLQLRPVEPPLRKSIVLNDLAVEIRNASRAWVVEIDRTVCGMASIELEQWNRRALLRHFYVAESKRRQGIGRELLGHVLTDSVDLGSRCLWVETQNTNFPAIQFYRNNGFQLCGLDTSLYDQTGSAPHETALYFVRRLEVG